VHLDRQTRHGARPATRLPAGPYDPEIGLVEACETANKLRAGEEIEALKQQPQDATRDPVGRDYDDPFFSSIEINTEPTTIEITPKARPVHRSHQSLSRSCSAG
jgi:hypothetical protein